MTPYSKLARGLKLAGFGYLFLYCNMDIQFFTWTLPLLPNCAGWLLLASSIRLLGEGAPTLSLLRPFPAALAVWSLGQFLPLLELPGWLSWLELLVSIVQLYFHFQLLTDVAGLAGRFQPQLGGRGYIADLLRARTVVTVVNALMFLPSLVAALPQGVALLIMFAWLGAGLVCIVLLFRLSGAFSRCPAPEQ